MNEFFKIKLQFILGYTGILLVLISINPFFLNLIIFSLDKINLTISNIFVVHIILVIISLVFYGMIFVRNKFNKNNIPKLFGDIFYLLSFLWILIVLVSYMFLFFTYNYSYYLNRNTIPPLLSLSFILIMLFLVFDSEKYIKKLKNELLEYFNSSKKFGQVKQSSQYKFFYRLIDIFLSCGTICFLFPILLFSYILLKLESRASSIVKIKKIGEHGKEFYMYKFRTSTLMDNGIYKTSKIGLFLRRAAVDELPILFNVLFNKMTLIGPRPLSNDSLKTFDEEYKNLYKKHKPGVLSLSSIVAIDQKFHNNFDSRSIAEIETFYMDFMIALNTVKLVIFSKN